MKKVPNWIIIILIIGAFIVSKFLFFAKKDDKANGASKSKSQMPVMAKYVVATKQVISNSLSVIGKTGAFNQVDILPEISGKITSIFFKEGESVSKGTVLVKLNDADWQAQLLKIKTQIKLSELKLNRLKQLLQVKGISQEEYDVQESELNVQKAEEAYTLAQIAKTSIVAPFSGVLGLKKVSEGAFVNSSTPIVSLVQLNPLFIEFSLPEKYSQLIKKGDKIDFKMEQGKGPFEHSASVFAMEPFIDENTKSIKIRALMNESEGVYPGVFVLVQVNLKESNQAVMLPTQCIVPTLKGQKVYVYKNGEAKETLVKIGFRNDQQIEIVEGVQVADTILSTGLQGIKKDSKIKLLRANN